MHQIVEYIYYRTADGRSFSRYSSMVPDGAELVRAGWTIRWADGTEGTGRVPFTTREEAEIYLAKVPATFKGMSQLGR